VNPSFVLPATSEKARIQNRFVVEAGKLLDDVKCALESDIAIATTTAARLADLLAKCEVPPGPARGGLAPWQKRRVVKFIEEQLGEPLPVGELARLVSLSTNHFSRAFKESFGGPPHAFIVRARIERAGEMMLTTSERIAEIALSCGFADQAHLCHCFRRATGMSPAAWRRKHAAESTSIAAIDGSRP